jgi:hypothetical protein
MSMLDCDSPDWEPSEDDRGGVVSGGWEIVTKGRERARVDGGGRVKTGDRTDRQTMIRNERKKHRKRGSYWSAS